MEGHPDARHVRTTFRHIAQPTLADVENLYHEILDNCNDTTIQRAYAVTSKKRRNRPNPKYTRPPRDHAITNYNCSFCKVDNLATRDCRYKNWSRADTNTRTYKHSAEVANAVAIALATLAKRFLTPPPGERLLHPRPTPAREGPNRTAGATVGGFPHRGFSLSPYQGWLTVADSSMY
jgi:hypothetical protein